jgi:Protein of unknown function (DUF2442)
MKRPTLLRVVAARYDRRLGRVVLSLTSRVDVMFAPADAQGLEKASPADLEEIEISPSGFGIHFPKLDADLYVPALLEGFLGSRTWMAARLGEKGGRSRSAAKRKAAKSRDPENALACWFPPCHSRRYHLKRASDRKDHLCTLNY